MKAVIEISGKGEEISITRMPDRLYNKKATPEQYRGGAKLTYENRD
jgi:hypothetical protein